MRETIQNYFEKTKEIDKGVFLVKRKDETDLSVFEEKYGYRWRGGK